MSRLLRVLVWAIVFAGVVLCGCEKKAGSGGESDDPNTAAASK